ncbi:MAG: hypothetical protein M1823_003809 [Watsoniomyces obsoletus]|nr:MAG: hypothetical protein M1823_003809 [Watsoniomyces obsoletus]
MPRIALSSASRLRLERLMKGLGVPQLMNEKAMYHDLVEWIDASAPSLFERENLSEKGFWEFRDILITHVEAIRVQQARIQAISDPEQQEAEEADFNTYVVAIFVKVYKWKQQQLPSLPPVGNLLAWTGGSESGPAGPPSAGSSA